MNYRFRCLEISNNRKIIEPNIQPIDDDYYGILSLNSNEFPTELKNKITNSLNNEEKRITNNVANDIATYVKKWAIENKATRFTHWFSPLNGGTAEKHDALFVGIQTDKMSEFSGKDLIQQEPDASSFPSGGIRNTFEARGYSAWDPTSPFFIIDDTLCIPSVFVSYTGEALDFKSPLLKTLNVLDKAATDVCKYFHTSVNKVISTLGWEQEYFLVDSALYSARPDLVLAGRTLFGHSSAKDQQLSDHYFGVIPERALNFMKDLEYNAHLLGIPIRTRHNEVAPNQFECAPIFEEANVAVDHNQLLMVIMDKIARKHDLRVLLHEKPFAHINGSGKHCNWSLQTDTGINLLSPGKTEKENLRFLVFLVNTLKAVYDYNDLLRASIATPGNDLRLGGHEAPPAIISAFVGTKLTEILSDFIENNKVAKNADEKEKMELNIPRIPEILLDNTDRNRTSPFAFTGNKFEFRAVGSSSNCAPPMISLNLAVANQLKIFKTQVDEEITKGSDKNDALIKIINKTILESKNVLFEGNNYTQEWVEQAKKRKLSNIKTSDEAIRIFTSPKVINLFESNNILTKRELEARRDIKLEQYVLKMQIESRVIGDLAINHIIPIAIQYQNRLYENYNFGKSPFVKKMIEDINTHITQIKNGVESMIESRKLANNKEDIQERSKSYREDVVVYFDAIRYHVDKLELMVDDELWPLPKYRELLFL